ncbi:MAG: hypothetical protein PHQ43_08905 [Dehalococcoidales bacterium]|nr:hypothetical protein [Dehalococcoidales bacterium]
MSEKRMLILPAELVEKIDENRGDVGRSEFIEFLISGQLKEESKEAKRTGKAESYVTKEELRSIEQDIKKLLRSFIDFFVNYGLEIGKQSPRAEFEELIGKLQGLEKDLDSDNDNEKKATIKWK